MYPHEISFNWWNVCVWGQRGTLEDSTIVSKHKTTKCINFCNHSRNLRVVGKYFNLTTEADDKFCDIFPNFRKK